MPKFVFKLQPMLNIKQQMEEQLKNEFGKAVQRLEGEKAVLLRLENEREEQIGRISKESAQGIVVEKLREYSMYISYLKDKIEEQKENVKLAQANADKYREQLIKAMQEREMLEKLKEKKLQEYLIEIGKEEQKINDEVVSFNYNKSFTGDKDG